MSINGFDPEILQDFITESGELLEQLEGDLVDLESTPQDPELLNQIFRALHTIKGSASFLAMTNLVAIAHVAESALNAARNERIVIGAREMDLLLAAVDVLKIQFTEITSGSEELTAADPALITSLSNLGEGIVDGSATDSSAATQSTESAPETEQPVDGNLRSLELDGAKLDLVDHLASDIEASLSEAAVKLEQLREDQNRNAVCNALSESFGELVKTIDFFEIPEMLSLAKVLENTIDNLSEASNQQIAQIVPRLMGLCILLREQNELLSHQQMTHWSTDALIGHIESLLKNDAGDAATLSDQADGLEALKADRVGFGDFDDDQAAPGSTDAEVTPTLSIPTLADAKPAEATQVPAKRAAIGQIEQTIRVEVGRLESLMNLVGELVLQKNRIGALSEDIQRTQIESTLIEQFESTTSTLDRVTGDIQLAVMRTRMQPLDKLFGKYPRLIRDLATKTQKKIQLVIEGAETEVDKSVIEELGDPLVHLLRNSGDHGIESPTDRIAKGKDETGTIKLIAGHAGSHVCVQIIDDGKGLDPHVIGQKAVEKGLVTQERLESLSNEEIYRFILEAGFSTAEQVSDLSGRGVGMDVVRTNIESKLKGELNIESVPGEGTTLTITIPLTVAIMPAMMVAVADEIFAIPLSNITEIVRPSSEQLSGIGNDPVIHLRGQVYPLISAQEVFDVPHDHRMDEDFVVVISFNQRVIGLKVSSVIGQQEIVIKPLDGVQREGPISGATIRNDGEVSLIMDIAKLIQSSKNSSKETNQSHHSHEPVAASGR